MRRPRWTLRCVALVFTSVALTGTVLPLSQARANPVADKRAAAAKIATLIDADSQRVDSLTARFEAAQLAVSDVDTRLAGSAAALQRVRRRLARTGLAVRGLAVSEFMKGRRTLTPVASMPGKGDQRGVVLGQLFAGIAVAKSQDVLDAGKAAQEDFQAHIHSLRAEQQRAHVAAAGVEAARRAAERAVARQQVRLGKVRGDLLALVRAEQARQQAAREAKARAMVARHIRPPHPTIAFPRARTAPDPFTSAPPVDASRASKAVAEAKRMLGKHYQWAAAGPNRFDCSGLTMWAWRAAGVRLAHYSGAQYGATTRIPLDDLRPGDLLFFHRNISHVGIYVGDGQMIHAPQTGDVVRYASIFSDGSPIYAGRVTH